MPAVTVMLDDGVAVFSASTVTTGTFRLELEPGSYDVRVGVAPPAQGEAIHFDRVVFTNPGDHRLDLALSSGRLTVLAPPSMEGESIAVGLLWKGSPIANHHVPVLEGRAEIEFRAVLPVPVLVAVFLPGETDPIYPPGVRVPVTDSVWALQPLVTSTSQLDVR